MQSQSVAQYLVSAVPTARAEDSAGLIRETLHGRRFADASNVFIVSPAGRLTGIVGMADLLHAAPAVAAAELMRDPRHRIVPPDCDREDAASLAIRAGDSTLAVCDRDGRFRGAIPATALMAILRDEHVEDLHLMAGIVARSEEARRALVSSPLQRALYRLPWVAVGLAGSIVITAIMTRFEAALMSNVALAFFVPALVYLADAVGTQTEVVAIRSLSLAEVAFRRFFASEVATGALVGLAISLLACALIWLAFGSLPLGIAVAVALLAATTVAAAVGCLLPWTFMRLGLDPALACGPIATVFQDALTLLIYFGVATALLL